MKIEVINTGTGNVRSIVNWFHREGLTVKEVESANQVSGDVLILPGVGSVGSFMKGLNSSGFSDRILSHVKSGGYLLGICLGFQVLGDFSDEDGGVSCLGLIPGRVKKLHQNHNGWEQLYFRSDNICGHWLSTSNLRRQYRSVVTNGRVFYNHEYGFIPRAGVIDTAPISKQHRDIAAYARIKNVIGVQFHPEKSQKTGDLLLRSLF